MPWENLLAEQLLVLGASSKRVILVTNSGSYLDRNIVQRDSSTWEATLSLWWPHWGKSINRDWWEGGWGLGKIGESVTKVVRKNRSQEERNLAQLLLRKVTFIESLWSEESYKGSSLGFMVLSFRSCNTTFETSHCWIFLTPNINKFGHST